jgi:hypoxanthine phosphoribosyltransferase
VKPEGTVRPLFEEARIAVRVGELGKEIAAASNQNVLLIAILKGSFVFSADLIRALHSAGLSPQIDFLSLSSYGEATESFGRVDIVHDISDRIAGRPVILVDDILESGRTLSFAKTMLIDRGAESVSACVLLDKKNKRKVAIEADFVGFDCPDQFVVGYGLDYAHYFRELPFIGVMETA